MGSDCERDHRELREDVIDARLALANLTKDLETVKNLLSSMANILQDNLVTISAHDKASMDWRGVLLTTVESAVNRINLIEREIDETNRFHESYEALRGTIESGLADVSSNRTLLLGILGMAPLADPPPLIRDLKETLGILRSMNDLAPDTGRAQTGLSWWWPRIKEAAAHGIVLAFLALCFNLLLPYLSLAKEAKTEAQQVFQLPTVPVAPLPRP